MKKKLGISDLYITQVGLGTWAIGGGNNPYGWGPQEDKDSINTIHCALDLGINWIDTAKGYGHGHSEEIVGKAITGQRNRVIIATKCGILWKEDGSDIYGCLKRNSIRKEVESSLKRLKTDVIDLCQIHWPWPDEDIEEGWEILTDLIREGKLRYAGVCNFSVSQLERIKKIYPITSLQPPYSMINREIEKDLLGYCAKNNIGVIVYSPMQSGLLTGKFTKERAAKLPDDDWRKSNTEFQEPRLSINLEFVKELESIAQLKSQSISNLAIAWTLRRPEVTGAIVGARRPDQINETITAAELELTEKDIEEIDEIIAKREQKIKNLKT